MKSAVLATDSTIVHYCQLHAIITQDSPIRVRIFQQREDAAKWLGVSADLLAAKGAAGETSLLQKEIKHESEA